jgi:hypothetical protein
MKFWRFNVESSTAIEASMKSRSIVLPSRLHPEAKNNPEEVVTKKLRIGDGILLAELLGSEGVVHAIGMVRHLANEHQIIVIDWMRLSTKLKPNTQGGLAQWQKEACFKFAEDPARRYNLAGLFLQHFGRTGNKPS